MPSLDKEPAVLWKKNLGWTTLRGEIVLAGEHMAVTTGNKLWILDRSGNVTGELLDASSQLGCTPAADPDGNFYFGTSNVYRVEPDGKVDWTLPLGSNLGKSQETTDTSPFLLSPDG
ncbi:MAG: hypothetical protein V2A73_07560, partial [Pseudomonadota bacterium]